MGVGGQSHDPVAEPRGQKPGTHFTGGPVGPQDQFERMQKGHPYVGSNPGYSSP